MPLTIAKRYSPCNSNLHISLCSRMLSNVSMEIREIRRKNLELLVAKSGGQAKLAETLGMKPSILSNIITDARGMGRAIARRIEKKLGLDVGWMDARQTEALAADILRAQLLDFWEKLEPDRRDALLGKANSLYAEQNPGGKSDPFKDGGKAPGQRPTAPSKKLGDTIGTSRGGGKKN